MCAILLRYWLSRQEASADRQDTFGSQDEYALVPQNLIWPAHLARPERPSKARVEIPTTKPKWTENVAG